MSTHGFGPVHRFVSGSVTHQVLLKTSVPVWTESPAKHVRAKDCSIRRVLCLLELTGHSRHTLALASQCATAFGAILTLVHVTSSVEVYGPGGIEDEGFATEEIAKIQNETGTCAEVMIKSGNVSHMLKEAAAHIEADFLIIGRIPGRSHLGDNGEGYGLIRCSHTPVLSF